MKHSDHTHAKPTDRKRTIRYTSIALFAVVFISVGVYFFTNHTFDTQGQYSYKTSGIPSFVDANAQPLCRSADAAAAAKAERDNLPYPKIDNPSFCANPTVCKDNRLLISYDRDSLLAKQEAYVYLATDDGSSIGSVWITPNGDNATAITSSITGFAYTPNSTAKFKISGDVISTYQYGFFNGQEGISKVHIKLGVTNECGKHSQKLVLSDVFTPSKEDVASHSRKTNQNPQTELKTPEQE